ncbi:MAG TPA: DUF5318 family protein [Acidimicrobiales bacterium]|nr:DUF5318 family protein [Acidimicrobiales bacterium]
MGFRPEVLRGATSGGHVTGQVDYRLARNLVVTEFRKGRLSRHEVCDAHPELLRAAASVGEESREDCPICEAAKLRLVSYVFGRGLPPSGRMVTSKTELRKLSRVGRDLTCYVVEVCPDCSWNHLAHTFPVATRRQASSQRATT